MNQSNDAGVFSKTAILLEHLKLTRDQVAAGEQHIAEQKQLIGVLSGEAITWATKFLSTLEHMQAMYVAHRNRLEQELVTANPE